MPHLPELPFETAEEVVAFINTQKKPAPWVEKARKNHKKLKALVAGVGFNELLINKIEHIESDARAKARVKYAKDIRDMFERVMQPRANVFSASGGSVSIKLPTDEQEERFIEEMTHFKGQKPIKKYLSENYFHLLDTDPNGIIFLEYIEDEKIFPTYKSIDDIRYYKSDGQLMKVLLFEPKNVIINNKELMLWRCVDSKTDWTIIQDGDSFTWLEDKTFKHPFGEVPGIILSDKKKMGKRTELRFSPLFPVEKLAEDYARDKSVLTIYKFQHGFPIHWRYRAPCRQCHGTGKNGENKCTVCGGKGEVKKNDVTDIITLDLPTEKEDAVVAPNVTGFVAPDLDTWSQYNEDLIGNEERIENTIWGTHRKREGENETATGRFIDTQPVINKLDTFSDMAEWAHNQLADWTIDWIFGEPQKEDFFHITYGRRFIIESPDVVLKRYEEARTSGVNSTILDKLLDEYLLAKYQNDPRMLNEANKKRTIEPYVHETIDQVNEIFGAAEAAKKVVFVKFWEDVDKTKPVEELEKEWLAFLEELSEGKGLSEEEKTLERLRVLPADVTNTILLDMTPQQRLNLVGVKLEKQPEPIQKPNDNDDDPTS